MRLYHSLLFLPLASSVYSWTIDPSCDGRDEVIEWMDEALLLFQRGGRVLQEALNMPVVAGNVKEILDAVLGTNAGTSQYQQVLGEHPNTLTFRLRKLSNRKVANFQDIDNQIDAADIHLRCSNPITQSTGEFELGKVETKTVYPVSLRRVGADPQIYLQSQQSEPWWYDGQDFFIIVNEGDLVMAFVVTSEDPGIMQTQVSSTGSQKLWSDIVFREILNRNVPTNFYPGYWSDWSLQGMSRSLFDLDYPGSVTIMHELMHTHIVRDTCKGHKIVDIGGVPGDANGLYSVLLLGSGNTDAPLNNPDSYAWLAILLSMPWYKWWDRTTTPPVFDGAIRENLFQYPTASGVVEFTYIPEVFRARRDPLSSAEVEVFKKGPYALWDP
ncbi:MAG: hypothetical protein M1840_003337 [Geoglossum simile]|nr:MAG: hypothetical protein M1840_003337 [Geoglossum simile]